MLNRKSTLGALGFAACIAASSQLIGAELTPYRLPSEDSYPEPQTQSIQRGAPQQSDSREEYYSNFEQKARGLTKGERDDLIGEFSRKQRDALKAGDDDVAKHYFRLMEILSKGDKK